MLKLVQFALLLICVMAYTDYYDVLGLPKTATLKRVKKQFRELSLKYHPDKNTSQEAERRYKEITHAYQQILNGKSDDRDDQQKEYQNRKPTYEYKYYEYQWQDRNDRFYYEKKMDGQTSQVKNYTTHIFFILIFILISLLFRRALDIKGEAAEYNASDISRTSSLNSSWTSVGSKRNQPVQFEERVSKHTSYTDSTHRQRFHDQFGN
ncbi:hypothetical protein pb186bvf_001837 [Paramecium bursaria]